MSAAESEDMIMSPLQLQGDILVSESLKVTQQSASADLPNLIKLEVETEEPEISKKPKLSMKSKTIKKTKLVDTITTKAFKCPVCSKTFEKHQSLGGH